MVTTGTCAVCLQQLSNDEPRFALPAGRVLCGSCVGRADGAVVSEPTRCLGCGDRVSDDNVGIAGAGGIVCIRCIATAAASRSGDPLRDDLCAVCGTTSGLTRLAGGGAICPDCRETFARRAKDEASDLKRVAARHADIAGLLAEAPTDVDDIE